VEEAIERDLDAAIRGERTIDRGVGADDLEVRPGAGGVQLVMGLALIAANGRYARASEKDQLSE
jgi:hypothetical protein